MSRLRVRIELNRGGAGVPLHKLSSIALEAHKFLRMLGDDVHIDQTQGEWLALDFDDTSLNFTAEFIGPVEPPRVQEFYAAFDGSTLLRRNTIAQFARIADAIDEDEIIGFGLFEADEDSQPAEWRSLSRRDALHITSEIDALLAEASAGESASPLPPAIGSAAGAQFFRERHEREPQTASARTMEAFVRSIEARVLQRITRLESDVQGHTEAIEGLRGKSVAAEQSMQKLLGAVEDFCDRAAGQFARAAHPIPLPAVEQPIPAVAAPVEPPALETTDGTWPRYRWQTAAAAVLVLAIGGFAVAYRLYGDRPRPEKVEAARPDPPHASPPPVSTPAVKAAPKPAKFRVELTASEPTWVAVYSEGKQMSGKLLNPGDVETVDASVSVRVRVGNAGGLSATWNGTPVGPLGPKGQIRVIDFTREGFQVSAPKSSSTD